MTNSEDVLYQQSMEARLEGMKERVEYLRKENASLKQSAAKNEKDTHEFVTYFQTEMEKKDQMIAKMSEKLISQEMAFEKESEALNQKSETAIASAQRELEEAKSTSSSKIAALEDELRVLSEYKHKRDILHNKLQDTEKELRENALKHKSELHDVERAFIEKSAKLQRDVEQRVEEIKRQAREDAQQGLDADTRKIISDNKRMSEELRFQLQMSDELQEQGKLLIDENKRLKRNLQLASEKEKEYARRGYYRDNEVSVLKGKLKTLERAMQRSVREFEQNKNEMKQSYTKEQEDLKLEVSGLKQLIKIKNKELKNIRQLSKVILDQRTEVEQYFLESLEQVKSEIRKRREEAYRASEQDYRMQMRLAQSDPKHNVFPAIRPGHSSILPQENTAASISELSSVKIELNDLSWEDRERVLRVLFAKINANEPENSTAALGALSTPGPSNNQSLAEMTPYRPSARPTKD